MPWLTTSDKSVGDEIQNWLKLAAFVLRNREIKLGDINNVLVHLTPLDVPISGC